MTKIQIFFQHCSVHNETTTEFNVNRQAMDMGKDGDLKPQCMRLQCGSSVMVF